MHLSEAANQVRAVVRRPCYVDRSTDFERFTPYVRDLSKKQAVTSESLEKIENGEAPALDVHQSLSLIDTIQLRMLLLSADLSTIYPQTCSTTLLPGVSRISARSAQITRKELLPVVLTMTMIGHRLIKYTCRQV